jgi:quinol---cytochrome c reductase cytochrome c subunit, bacillus type
VNRQEKEQYLREYEVMKKKGKPFFPYAIMKDSVMAVVVVAVIIAMSLWLGAEQGPKADPTTTTYVPRPEWYFFFLFEVLRVIKPPELVPIATIGIPTIAMVLLFLLPFYDRNPERNPLKRPIATTAGLLTIAAMAFLTFLGAEAGSPTEIDIKVAPEYEAGKLVAAQSGCLACHQFEHNGNNGPGPKLTEIGKRLNPAAISRSLQVGPGIMPSYSGLMESDPEKFRDLVLFLGSLTGEEESSGNTGLAGGTSVEGGGTEDTSGSPGAASEDTGGDEATSGGGTSADQTGGTDAGSSSAGGDSAGSGSSGG